MYLVPVYYCNMQLLQLYIIRYTYNNIQLYIVINWPFHLLTKKYEHTSFSFGQNINTVDGREDL